MHRHRGKYIFDSETPEIKQIQSDIRISKVTGIEDFKNFFQVAQLVYQGDRYWVPPFWVEQRDFFREMNPFWSHAETQLFVAWNNKTPVGRIAAIIDHNFCDRTKEKIGYFGFFESVKNFRVASALFNMAKEWLTVKGMTLMRGPINGRIDVGCGFLYDGFNSPPSLLSSYSPYYYLDFAKQFGMKKSRDQLVYQLDLTQPIPKYLKKSAEHCKKKGVKIRRFNRLQIRKEMKWWIEMMLDTFSEHWGYAPVSYEEVKTRFGVKQARWLVDSNLFLVAEMDDQPIGFIWSTPDYNQVFKKMDGNLGLTTLAKFLWYKKKINQGKFNLIATRKEYRNQGIASCMNYHTMQEMKKRGYISAEIGWVDEQNSASLKIIEKTGAKLYKKFRVYEINI